MATPAVTPLPEPSPAEDVPAAILIVDDKRDNLTALSAALANGGYAIDTAMSGPEALKKVLQTEYAVILLDVMMPDMDGFEVAATIRQRKRSEHTPIVFLTAIARDVASMFKGYTVGAVDYVTKPVDPDVIRAKVAVFVELYRTKERLRRQSALLHAAERREFDMRMAAEKANTERRYRDLANAVPQILFIATPDGAFKHWNQRWTEYTGGSASERALDEVIYPDDRDRFQGQWQAALRTGNPVQIELRLRRKDGTYRWQLFRAVAETRPGGEVEAWIGTFTDIDERIQSEFERTRLLRLEAAARQRADQAVTARDEFISIASHELKSPITALSLKLQLLARKLAAASNAHPDVAEFESLKATAETAQRQIERLAKMINEMLDVTRIQIGKFEIQRQAVDLAEVARDVAMRYQDEAAQKGGAIRLHVEADVEGLWDPDRLDQIVTNLLTNAIRYGGSGAIDVTLRRSGDDALLTVADHGPGIPDDIRTRIFEKFERGKRPGSREGLGLGLFITSEIVKAHGGTIAVESELGAGTTFTVRLPIGRPAEHELAQRAHGDEARHETH